MNLSRSQESESIEVTEPSKVLFNFEDVNLLNSDEEVKEFYF